MSVTEDILEMEEMAGEELAHEGDNAIFVRLAMRAIEVRGIVRKLSTIDPDTCADLVREEVQIQRSMVSAHKISREQRDRLFLLLVHHAEAVETPIQYPRMHEPN